MRRSGIVEEKGKWRRLKRRRKVCKSENQRLATGKGRARSWAFRGERCFASVSRKVTEGRKWDGEEQKYRSI